MTKYVNNNGVSEMWLNIKNWVTSQLLGKSDTNHTHTASDITSGLATVATSGSYNDLSNKPTIPTVNNATLTIQQNGTNVQTFTANQSTNATANITVPTKTSDLTNDSGFLTSHQDLSDYVTLNDAQTIPGNKTFSGLTKTTGKLSYFYSGNDLNNAIYNIETTYWGPDTANRPSSSDYGTLLSFNREVNVHTSYGVGWIAQLGIGTNSRLYLRTKTNLGGAWENWKEFITINEAVPRSGANDISGDLIPATDNSIDIGSSTNNIKMLYTNGITINGTQFLPSDYVPRSGGAVFTGQTLHRTNTTGTFDIGGGTSWNTGALIALRGANRSVEPGIILFQPATSASTMHWMYLHPTGTWQWSGQAIQYTSDQRYKQQISQIDDDLLTAWEDVEPVQFKYNDAVETKSDNARLHTGYVVQQIDEACKKHNVDVSKYGLYCHEVYQEETREVEQADGTKTIEVVRSASEHYSLRYTEALIVECAYLRKCIKELRTEVEELKSSK